MSHTEVWPFTPLAVQYPLEQIYSNSERYVDVERPLKEAFSKEEGELHSNAGNKNNNEY